MVAYDGPTPPRVGHLHLFIAPGRTRTDTPKARVPKTRMSTNSITGAFNQRVDDALLQRRFGFQRENPSQRVSVKNGPKHRLWLRQYHSLSGGVRIRGVSNFCPATVGRELLRAEGEGVEPSVAFQLRRFSKPMH